MTLFDTPGEPFHIYNGPSVRNLQELIDYLPAMTDEQFEHHVHGETNDFATWVEHREAGERLVAAIREAGSRDGLRDVLVRERDGNPEHVDEESFLGKRQEYDERNEAIQEKFDRLAEEMREGLQDELPGELERLEESLRERYALLRERVTALRKKGKDVFLASLVLRTFRGKLAYAHSTKNANEYGAARRVLEAAEEELVQAEREKPVDVRGEVLALAGEGLNTDEADGTVRGE